MLRFPLQRSTSALLFGLGIGLVMGFAPSTSGAFKVYGNWCGPNHGFGKPPIDAVDSACQAHDICCRKHKKRPFTDKIQHCDCDAILLRGLKSALSSKLSTQAKAAGAGILSYFSAAPCFCHKEVCLPETNCTTQEKCKKVAGKKVCVKVPSCKTEKVCKKRQVMGAGGRCP